MDMTVILAIHGFYSVLNFNNIVKKCTVHPVLSLRDNSRTCTIAQLVHVINHKCSHAGLSFANKNNMSIYCAFIDQTKAGGAILWFIPHGNALTNLSQAAWFEFKQKCGN